MAIMAITTFSSFRSRNYRLFFTGQSISLIGTWMQKTAVSWVIYSLTHSKFMLGVSVFATLFPSFMFSFLGGVVADRYDRYRLLLVTQAASMIQAVVLTVMVCTGYYNVAWILVLSAILGTINAFDVPARQSLVYEMVDDKKTLPNALALNSSMVNLPPARARTGRHHDRETGRQCLLRAQCTELRSCHHITADDAATKT
jgi:MFS family permease